MAAITTMLNENDANSIFLAAAVFGILGLRVEIDESREVRDGLQPVVGEDVRTKRCTAKRRVAPHASRLTHFTSGP